MTRAQRVWKYAKRCMIAGIVIAGIGCFAPFATTDVKVIIVVVQMILLAWSFFNVSRVHTTFHELDKTHGLKVDMHIEAEVTHDTDAVWNHDGLIAYTAVVKKDDVVVAMFLNRADAYKYIAMLEAQ